MNKTSWLARFPVGLFAIPVGLFALAGAWRRTASFGWPAEVQGVGAGLAWLGVAVLSVLLGLAGAHPVRTGVARGHSHPRSGHADHRIPARGSGHTRALHSPGCGWLCGAMALGTLGYPGWAALLFGMGLVSWGLLEVRVLNRLFEGLMPEPLRPTIGVEMAPPA